jgi:hypothetical protein
MKTTEKDYTIRTGIYLSEPISQNTEPNRNAANTVKNSLTPLYCGLLQYTRFCFQRQIKKLSLRALSIC